MRKEFYRTTLRNICMQYPGYTVQDPPQAVLLALEKSSPKCYTQLALNAPQEGIATNVFYFQKPEHAATERLTSTSMAKFLVRHFPLPDHVIRDVVLSSCFKGEVKVYETTEDIIRSVQEGPETCMKWAESKIKKRGAHPYEVYDPALGWKSYVRIVNGEIKGRALVNNGKYVRCFGQNVSEGWRQADEQLVAWLEMSGTKKANSWPNGTKLALIEVSGGILAPYIDGDVQRVDCIGDFLVIEEEGEYKCTYQDGTMSSVELEFTYTCACCGDGYFEEPFRHAGQYEDEPICESCVEYYTLVTGYHGEEYYLLSDDVTCTVEGDCYDPAYLAYHSVVRIDQGRHADGYSQLENCVQDYARGIWHQDDIGKALIRLDAGRHSDEYAPLDETWTCAHTGLVLHDDDESVTASDGNTVSPEELTDSEEGLIEKRLEEEYAAKQLTLELF